MRPILIIIYLIFLFKIANSQGNDYKFSHFDTKDGLSHNWITTIYRDSQGFVWLGTFNGLNKYDGANFEIFENNPSDPNSLGNNTINAIIEDEAGNLWIGTPDGLYILNKKTNNFKRLNLTYPFFIANEKNYTQVNSLLKDDNNNIWIGTQHGLFRYNSNLNTKDHTQYYKFDTSGSGDINNIQNIQIGKDGIVYMISINDFLIKLDCEKNKKELFNLNVGNVRNVINVKKLLFIDQSNDLWIGSSLGLQLFDLKTNKQKNEITEKINKEINLNLIESISQDRNKMIWLATDGDGIALIDKKDYSIHKIKHLPNNENSLATDGLTSLYQDKTGIMWIGHRRQGVDFYKKSFNKFKLYKHNVSNANSLICNDVNCLLEDSKGQIWVGTNGAGLDVFDAKMNKLKHFEANNKTKNCLSSNKIVWIFEDHKGVFWIGTYFGGLNRYDPKTNTFSCFKHSDSDSSSISDDRIWNITEDAYNNLWIATLGSGLDLMNRETGTFKHFTINNSKITNNCLFSLYVDKSQILWLCSAYGLMQFNTKTYKVTSFLNNPNDSKTISGNTCRMVFCDSRDWLWIATNRGLNLMNRKTNTFRTFNKSNGLPSAIVLQIREDNEKNLWITTNNGISKMSFSKIVSIDNFDYSFRNYKHEDGLQGNEFNESSALKTKSGDLYFGGTQGLNSFNTSEIDQDKTIPKLVFTALRVYNEEIKAGQLFNNRIVLAGSIAETKKIQLKFDENFFSIDFMALTFFYPEKNNYQYKLEGFDKKWLK